MFKKILIIISIIIISGLSGIFANSFLFPRLASTKLFSKCQLLKKTAENITVINKTEQIYVKEDYSVGKFANQNLAAVVNILSYPPKSVLPAGNSFQNGTGIILTSDGIVMTHESVLAENGEIKIFSSDGNVYEGKSIGVDSWSGLAFIKIEASNLPVISFADSGEYKAGEKIIAVGNYSPEYQNSFTVGILKNKDHFFNVSGEALSKSEKLEGVFMTDFEKDNILAGSPVSDYSGQVIGVMGTSQRNGKNESFLIPSNKIKSIIKKVIDKSLDSNPVLGAYYLSLSKSFSMANNLEADRGAMIYSFSGQQGLAVISGSPAAKAGLKINDIIVKINNEEINLENNLSDILYKYKKGDLIEAEIIRSGERKKISIQL